MHTLWVIYGWSAILLINRALEIAHLQYCLYFLALQILDWCMATLEVGNPADRPDRLHFHQLAMRFLEIRFFGRDKRHIVNPLSTVVLVPLISAPQLLGVYSGMIFQPQFC